MRHPWMPNCVDRLEQYRERQRQWIWPSLMAWVQGKIIPEDPDLPPTFHGFDGKTHPENLTATAWRRYRLQKARRLGTHTSQEWLKLRYEWSKCAICGRWDRPLTKDHITPISRGGCDCIHNIQPVCHSCNCGKGAR